MLQVEVIISLCYMVYGVGGGKGKRNWKKHVLELSCVKFFFLAVDLAFRVFPCWTRKTNLRMSRVKPNCFTL